MDISARQASISFCAGVDGVCIYRETTSGHLLAEEIPTDFRPEQVSRCPGFSSSAQAACVHGVSTFVSVCRPFLHNVCSVFFVLFFCQEFLLGAKKDCYRAPWFANTSGEMGAWIVPVSFLIQIIALEFFFFCVFARALGKALVSTGMRASPHTGRALRLSVGRGRSYKSCEGWLRLLGLRQLGYWGKRRKKRQFFEMCT